MGAITTTRAKENGSVIKWWQRRLHILVLRRIHHRVEVRGALRRGLRGFLTGGTLGGPLILEVETTRRRHVEGIRILIW